MNFHLQQFSWHYTRQSIDLWSLNDVVRNGYATKEKKTIQHSLTIELKRNQHRYKVWNKQKLTFCSLTQKYRTHLWQLSEKNVNCFFINNIWTQYTFEKKKLYWTLHTTYYIIHMYIITLNLSLNLYIKWRETKNKIG